MSNDEEIVEIVEKLRAKAFDSEKVMKEHNIVQDDLEMLRKMASSSEFIPKSLMNEFFIIFLATCDNDKDKCLKLMHNYCKLKKISPEFFANRDVESDEIQQALDNQFYATLPSTPSNCNLVFHKLSNFEPKNYIFDATEKTFFMTIGKVF